MCPFDPNNGDMCVPCVGIFGNNAIYEIDTSTNQVIATLGLVPFPYAAAFNPHNGDMYIIYAIKQAVTIINSSNIQILDTVSVQFFPAGIMFNPENKDMYVTNLQSKTVSVLGNITNQVIATTLVWITTFDIAHGEESRYIYDKCRARSSQK